MECMADQTTVLRERHLQQQQQQVSTKITTQTPSTQLVLPSECQQKAVAALSRLQAQRTKRAEQRLTEGGGRHQPLAFAATFPAPSPSPLQQAATRRIKVTTTAGSGMQRQAPSRCSSTAGSVRASLDMLHTSPHPVSRAAPSRGNSSSSSSHAALAARQPPAKAAAAFGSTLTGVSCTKSPGKLVQQQQCRALAARPGSLGTQHNAAAAQTGCRVPVNVATRTLQVQGSSIHQQQPQQPQVECAMAVGRAVGSRSQQRAGSAARQAQQHAHQELLLGAAHMGCGIPWQELQMAVTAAAAAPSAGGHLQHRRHQQQCR